MSDIQAGDVVVCVRKHGFREPCPEEAAALDRLSVGRNYRVAGCGQDKHGNTGIDIGVPNSDIWYGFGDVWPPCLFAKIDSADHEFIALIKRVPVPA